MEWLLFLSQLPANPSGLRVSVWRKLRAAGAASLQNGVWILPHQPEPHAFLNELLETIRSQGASGQVFLAVPDSEAVQADILQRFQKQSEEEHQEFIERCVNLLSELEKETVRQKFTFAELEENEADLEKLKGWLQKIQKRDFFPGPSAAQSLERLAACRQALQAFARQVYSREGLESKNEPGDTQ